MQKCVSCFTKSFIAFGIVLCTASTAVVQKDAPFPLVDGDRQAIIVGRAHTLAQGVERCTGVKLEQVAEARFKTRPDRFPIYVGDTQKARQVLADEIAKLDAEGYIILVRPEYAIVYAPKTTTDSGDPITWAQGDFLRRFLGVDWFIPGELGEHYPALDRVLIPSGKWIETPAFKHRHWSGYCGKASSAWRLRASGGGGWYRYHHNLFRIISPKEHADHPEFFPVIIAKHDTDGEGKGVHRHLKPGERFVPPENLTTYWQPCTTNPEVLELTVKAVLDYFAKNPQADSFSLGINDSGGYCLCDRCLAVSPDGVEPDSDAANGYRFYRYYNAVAERVAKSHPNVRLGFLVYSDLTDWYPEKLHPLLMPYLTMSMADRWDQAYRKRQNEHIKRWSGIAQQFGIYEWLFGSGFLIPRIYLHEFVDGLRLARTAGAEGFYAEAYANWGLDGPKLWVAEQLLWDPKQDVDELLARWNKGMFAEAAEPMRAYFDYLEQAWRTQQPSDDRRGGYRMLGSYFKGQQFTDVFRPDVCERAWQLLERAEAAARSDSVRKRIAYFKAAFGATRLASNRYAAAVELDAMLNDERRQTTSLSEWVRRLDDWQRFGRLDPYMQRTGDEAPLSFQKFCQAQYVKSYKPSFRDWDTGTMALPHIVHKAINEAMSVEKNAGPEQLLKACDELLNRAGDFPHAKRLVRENVHQSVMTIEPLNEAPVVDGKVEASWGEPIFDGALVRYPYFDQRDSRRTRIWFRSHGNRFYAAFRCEQDRGTLGGEAGFMREILPLTDDLDKVSEELFKLEIGGSKEYCGQVVHKAASDLNWSESSRDLKTIFIAGNEAFTQGPVDFREACSTAANAGITVSTIFCGPNEEGVKTMWLEASKLADGSYMSIDHNQQTVAIDAPQDEQLIELNTRLNKTYVAYGSATKREESLKRQVAQDANASDASPSSFATRVQSKGSRLYNNARWDLCDACRLGRIKIEDLKEEDLPEDLRKMSVDERKTYIGKMIKERAEIQKQIKSLSDTRAQYVAEERKKLAINQDDTLDAAIISAVRKQAEIKKFTFEK